MEWIAAWAIVFMAAVMAVVELIDPMWAWWRSALVVTGLCAMAWGVIELDRRLP